MLAFILWRAEDKHILREDCEVDHLFLVPSGAPSLQLASRSANALKVNWSAVSIQKQGSPITSFTIYVANDKNCGEKTSPLANKPCRGNFAQSNF